MSIQIPQICVRNTGTEKGRGVFALRTLASGEVVEVCPVIVFLTSERVPLAIKHRQFNWSTLAGVPHTSALALGYGSMYNHASPANLRYIAIKQQELLQFVAARDIALDEELTINYNDTKGAPESQDDNWFRSMGIQPSKA